MGEFKETRYRAALVSTGRWMIENDLTWGNAGNASMRLNSDSLLITKSGARLGDMTQYDIVEAPIELGARPEDGGKPSKDLPMHQAVYTARPDINVVIHAEPLHSTLIASADLDVPANWFISGMYYLERVARVPYFHPGSMDLARAVGSRARKANVILLEHHGVVVCDTSIQEAMMALETLEFACRMLLLAKSAGLDVKGLPPDTVADFLENSGYKPRREWPST